MKARITVSINSDGLLEIWVNPEGRKKLVEGLQRLDERNDHIHLMPDESGDIELSTVAYRPTDRVIAYGKILFRSDAWDLQYFPHVFEAST